MGLVAYYLRTHTRGARTHTHTRSVPVYHINSCVYICRVVVRFSVGRSIMCTSMMYPMQALLGWRSIVCIVGHVCVAAPALDIALAQPKFLETVRVTRQSQRREQNCRISITCSVITYLYCIGAIYIKVEYLTNTLSLRSSPRSS